MGSLLKYFYYYFSAVARIVTGVSDLSVVVCGINMTTDCSHMPYLAHEKIDT